MAIHIGKMSKIEFVDERPDREKVIRVGCECSKHGFFIDIPDTPDNTVKIDEAIRHLQDQGCRPIVSDSVRYNVSFKQFFLKERE